MRTLRLTLAYDGTRYAGWQRQRRRTASRPHHAARTPTIQETVERALQRILQEPVTLVGSGRTDAGVHAQAQVAHIKTRAAVSCDRLRRSLNQLLPPDISVMRLTDTHDTFHARFDTARKQYRYRVFTGEVVPPFIHPYVHHVQVPLNLPLMRREAALLRGRHDFRAFTKSGSANGSTVRVITAVQLRRRGAELHLDIVGNGFLRTMVRSIAGTLLDIGRGRRPPGTVRRMLRNGTRELTGTTAPAKGLILLNVEYGGKG